MQNKFSLKEIADWQLKPEHSKIELPSVQRGFVWKPKQVEDLWDSILREYPIGSFLLSKTGDTFYLMDGQQRATSIFLGYFNPFDANNATKAWTIKGELPVVWIDILPNNKPDTSKYLIRLTTRSHPWGYQSRYNGERLSLSDKRKALEIYRNHSDNEGKGYTSFKNTSVFPYDSAFPIPLSFFIESNTTEEVIEKVNLFIPNYFRTKYGNFENKNGFMNLLETDLLNDLTAILETVKKIHEREINYDIVFDSVLKEENETEDPVLFIRINSAGTTLTGDDLIYSIYKAMFPEAKDLVERASLNFIAPTQIISMASRIAASDLNNCIYTAKMNVRDFQRRIKNENFKNTLKNLIESNVLEQRFKLAINILSCENNSLFEGKIPPVIIKSLIKKEQDLFLFFVYWLHKHENVVFTDEIKLKMVAKLMSFSLFNFGNIQQLWNEKINDFNFWKNTLNQLIWWNDEDGIDFILPPNDIRGYYKQPEVEKQFRKNKDEKWQLLKKGVGENIIQYYVKIKGKDIDIETADKYFTGFIERIKNKKQLILFAQRDYINSTFGDYNQMDDIIEDTNVPWDWDHIYPSEWVYKKWYCHASIRDWHHTNGNLRAISLEHNRSRGNRQSPNEILDEKERKNSYILHNDWEFWKKIGDRIWDDKIENHFRAITTRMISIYEKFWDDLKINELIKYQ